MKWTEGRQGTGYHKMLLWQARWPLPHDVYLLRYRVGSHIPWHTDPVDGCEHHRLNIVLKQAVGGDCILARANDYFKCGRITKFRPDITKHFVLHVKEGTRYVLSIGWLR